MLQEHIKHRIMNATVRLPKGGCGVLIPGNFILTAAHCVRFTIEGDMALGGFYIEDITTEQGTLQVTPFAIEPVSDVAVLGALDGQTFYKECNQFEGFCENTLPVPLCLRDFEMSKPFTVCVYTHEKRWVQGEAAQWSPEATILWVEYEEQIKGGTSGSPVINEEGEIVGVVSFTNEGAANCNGAAARPNVALPYWVVRRIVSQKEQTDTVAARLIKARNTAT